jgi:ABC-type amino acid transport substrate-binding protein
LQSYDAIVGDVTILANRSRNVSFTQPYTESGLSLIFPAENEDSAWLFMKPFSTEMWIATAGILIYTMFVIWFVEHHLNPEFGGPLKTQISTTLWFAFTSLFFAHSKSILHNFKTLIFFFSSFRNSFCKLTNSNMIFDSDVYQGKT